LKPTRSYTSPDYFFFNGTRLIMRVNAGGYRSPSSHFPGTEMREMAADGKSEAGWSIMDTGRMHTMHRVHMQLTGSVNKFTSMSINPQVVVLQIHTDEIGNACSVPLIVKVSTRLRCA
jgi:hypothetical protein